jgi:hypothetical protein
LSTLAIDGSDGIDAGGRSGSLVRFADLVVLAVGLPVFLLAGFPMLGYAVAAAAWLAAWGIQLAAERHMKRSLSGGNRRSALGVLAAATLGRVWLVALAILLVGLSEREAGLAAAVLTAALVTFHLGGMAAGRLMAPEEEEG